MASDLTQAQPIPPRGHSWRSVALICGLLFGATAIVFWPACSNGFVNLDDNSYVCNKPQVLSGLTSQGVYWALTTPVVGNWHPVTMLSLQTDAQLFGRGAFGFHRTAVLLHAANAVMVFLMLFALTGSLARSGVVAALFALHPLRVESVAWVSERKDLLSGFFFCTTLLAYVHYTRTPSIGRYLLVACNLTLGLASKPMLVTTPCVLLLLDFWPLVRPKNVAEPPLTSLETETGYRAPFFFESFGTLGLVLEKLPLLAISAMFSLITLACQDAGIHSLADVSLTDRVTIAASGVVAYLVQTFWPFDLRPYYPLDEATNSRTLVAPFALIAITAFAIWQRQRRPYLLVGWLWFLGMLVPVSGLVQTGDQARADRYTYLPQIGLLLAVVWLAADLLKWRIKFSASLVAAALFGCTVLTIPQIGVWKNTEALWRRVLVFSPNDLKAVQCLANTLHYTGQDAAALAVTHDALRHTDASDEHRMEALALLLAALNEHRASEETITATLAHHPDSDDLYSHRGKARAAQGNWSEAAEDFERAVTLSPSVGSYPFYLAHALKKLGNHDEATRHLAAALKRNPKWPQQAAEDAWRMSTSSDPREHTHFWPVYLAETAIECRTSNMSNLLDVLAAAYANDGRFDEAIRTATDALELATPAHQTALEKAIGKRLDMYARHKPFRESRPEVNPVP